jgi:hypothetical protein
VANAKTMFGRIAKYADKKNIYRTDLSGTVVVISDGEGIGIKTEK